MKGLYLSNLDGEKAAGYQAKILGQIQGLAENGLEFELIFYSKTGQVVLDLEPTNSLKPSVSIQVLKQASSNLLIRRKRLLDAALERIKNNSIDILYVRYPRSDPMYLHFLYQVKQTSSAIRIFSEFPTFPYDQERPSGNLFKHIIIKTLDFSTRYFLRFFIDQIIVVNYTGSIFGIPSIRIINGIDVSSFSHRKIKDRTKDQVIHFLGVANVKAWHGFDRVIEGISEFYYHNKSMSVKFHIVGASEPILGNLEKQVHQLKIDEHIFFYPTMQGRDLDQLFDLCDIGVSTLAAHRINLQELSPLKSREYCARGLPFILGYSDPDFPDQCKFTFQVPATDQPLDIAGILNFIERVVNEPNYSLQIREYAESSLDWKIKMSVPAKEMLNCSNTS